MISEIKRLMKEFEAAEEKMNEIDAAYDANPENEELEKAWSAAYRAEFEARERLIAEIVSFTKGLLTTKNVRAMLAVRREELKRLLMMA